jgi:hypothetical protein
MSSVLVDKVISFCTVAVILLTYSRLQTFGLLYDGRSRADFTSRVSPVLFRLSDLGKGNSFLAETDSEHVTGPNIDAVPVAKMHSRRFKRDDNQKLIVNLTTLPDEGHNEAVVHWSGQKSQVCPVIR